MSTGEVVAFVVLILTLVVPFLLILPSLLELLFGIGSSEIGSAEEDESTEDQSSSGG